MTLDVLLNSNSFLAPTFSIEHFFGCFCPQHNMVQLIIHQRHYRDFFLSQNICWEKKIIIHSFFLLLLFFIFVNFSYCCLIAMIIKVNISFNGKGRIFRQILCKNEMAPPHEIIESQKSGIFCSRQSDA